MFVSRWLMMYVFIVLVVDHIFGSSVGSSIGSSVGSSVGSSIFSLVITFILNSGGDLFDGRASITIQWDMNRPTQYKAQAKRYIRLRRKCSFNCIFDCDVIRTDAASIELQLEHILGVPDLRQR